MDVSNSLPPGIYAAAVTPLSDDGEALAPGGVGPLLAFLESKGLAGALVGGSTGEFSSLTFDERIALIDEAGSTKGSLRLMVGCGSSSLKESLALAARAGKRGADALLLPPPYYFRSAAPEGIEEFFARFLRNTDLPVLLYHIPVFTGIPVGREMLERLAEAHGNLWGIKDTGGKLSETAQFLAGRPGRVLLGSDSSLLNGLRLGVQGAISALSNVCPEWTNGLFREQIEGRDGSELQKRIVDLKDAMKGIPNHAALKYLLGLRGLVAGGVRAPLLGLSRTQREHLERIFLSMNLPPAG